MKKQLIQKTEVYTFYDYDALMYELKGIDKDDVLHIEITKQTTELENQLLNMWVVTIITEVK